MTTFKIYPKQTIHDLKKTQLIIICEHFDIKTTRTTKKTEICMMILKFVKKNKKYKRKLNNFIANPPTIKKIEKVGIDRLSKMRIRSILIDWQISHDYNLLNKKQLSKLVVEHAKKNNKTKLLQTYIDNPQLVKLGKDRKGLDKLQYNDLIKICAKYKVRKYWNVSKKNIIKLITDKLQKDEIQNIIKNYE